MGARRTKSARMERIYELYKLGMADSDIASEMGMMVSTVRAYLSEAKLKDLDAKKGKTKTQPRADPSHFQRCDIWMIAKRRGKR